MLAQIGQKIPLRADLMVRRTPFCDRDEVQFYDIAFRKKLYRSIEDLQADLDMWLAKYNEQRPHSGRYCYGKTPMQTFRETLHIAVERTIKTPGQSDARGNMIWR
ncbi:transposase [Palleronia caenipelagi]|uniref:Transposase n=1 Tax=Palleronia caenipelagi TaxID=2489174 RepID=A0A547PMI0_9RHOB|nr:transposase [Palleronia caenipelagi]